MDRWSPDRLSDEKLCEFARRYEDGKETVAALLKEAPGYTYGGLHAALKRQGVKFRGRKGPSPKKVTLDDPRVKEGLRLWEEGMSYVKAAETAGLASITLRRLIVESGGDPQRHWKGPGARNWNGGRTVNLDGYVRVALSDEDPLVAMRDGKGYVLEHRLVMARHLGRSLLSEETVHHGPLGKADNSIENLELWSGRHPKGQRVKDLLEFAHEIIERYGDLEDVV